AEVDEIGDVTLQLLRFGGDGRKQGLVAEAAAAQLAHRSGDGPDRRFEILADQREQGRADPVALARRSMVARLLVEPGALESEGELVEQVDQQGQGRLFDRRSAVVAGQADGAEDGAVRADRM